MTRGRKNCVSSFQLAAGVVRQKFFLPLLCGYRRQARVAKILYNYLQK